MVIFTGRLKRGNYGSFCSPNAFNSHFDNSVWLKGCLSETRPSPLVQNDHLEPKLSLCCRFAMKREWWHPFLQFVFFTCYGYTKKYIIKGGNLDSRSCIFLDMNDLNFRTWSHREVRDIVKTAHFSPFLQHQVIWGYLVKNIKLRKSKTGLRL